MNRLELAYEEMGQQVQTLERERLTHVERLQSLEAFQTMAMRWIEDFKKDAAFDDTTNVSTPPEELQPAEPTIQ